VPPMTRVSTVRWLEPDRLFSRGSTEIQ
jgi:hypothetical protein